MPRRPDSDPGHDGLGNGHLTSAPVSAARGAPARAVDGGPTGEVSVPVIVGEAVIGDLVAPDAHGDLAIAARLVLHSAAASAGGFSTWPGGPARSRPGRAANCWPNC